ncbi:MAG TPA: hypothetical protein VHW67_07805 [Solirubrobacteraceae bacterium]|jgi:hypothetical protein|nr:hypothetical protein [Solirubrobacteraceae bacterium]
MTSMRSAGAASAASLLLAALALAPGAPAASTPTTVSTTPGTPTTPATAPPPAANMPTACGPRAPEVLATTAGTVAERIYAAEVHSSETDSDKRQIESYAPLLSAVQSDDHEALKTAVHHLVYSHTHIVRLRVSRGSDLLYDEGGPYILAPVEGRLRLHGKEIGHFVFSVQDDLGYVKLETRFIGAPLVLRTESGPVPVEGLLSPGPASIPDHGTVGYRGANYEAYSFNAAAYPSGRLRVSLLLPLTASLATNTCDRIKAAELGLVAQRISRRFTLSQSAYPGYIRLVQTMTHALVYVSSGSHTLAGSTHASPQKLPGSGPLRWHGVDYEVSSFSAPASGGSVRVSVLVAR